MSDKLNKSTLDEITNNIIYLKQHEIINYCIGVQEVQTDVAGIRLIPPGDERGRLARLWLPKLSTQRNVMLSSCSFQRVLRYIDIYTLHITYIIRNCLRLTTSKI